VCFNKSLLRHQPYLDTHTPSVFAILDIEASHIKEYLECRLKLDNPPYIARACLRITRARFRFHN